MFVGCVRRGTDVVRRSIDHERELGVRRDAA